MGRHHFIQSKLQINNTTMRVITALLAVFAVAVADNPNPGYGPHVPVNYHYAYEVQDDYSHVNYGQEEGRNGIATNGQYHVLLPDGRTQTVTYNVGDAYTGYVADVTYSGEAAPAPAYKPAPAYQPAPSYKPALSYKPAPVITYNPARPVYKPVVFPKPAPSYQPIYQPAPVYKPALAYKPAPAVTPAPAPEPTPAPEPAPAPEPVITTEKPTTPHVYNLIYREHLVNRKLHSDKTKSDSESEE